MNLKTRCHEHWKRIGIRSAEDLKDCIDAFFTRHQAQSDVLVDIYRLAIPDWDQIKEIKGFPEAGNDLWKFICRRFITFDEKHHPDVFKGGLWMNSGFSSNPYIGPWEISFDNCVVVMT